MMAMSNRANGGRPLGDRRTKTGRGPDVLLAELRACGWAPLGADGLDVPWGLAHEIACVLQRLADEDARRALAARRGR